MTPFFRSLILIFLFSGIAEVTRAQSANTELTEAVERQRDQLKKRTARGEVRDDTREDEDEDSEKPTLSTETIIPSLKGIRLVGDPTKISQTEAVQFSKPKVEAKDGFTRVPPPEESVLEAVVPYLGKPVSLASLQEMTEVMIEAYRETEYPLVDIYLPPQNVTHGVLQFVVLEATLEKLSVDGARHSNPEFLKRQMRISPGDRINRIEVEENLDYLNENPFRRVDLVYRRGEAEGTSNILLKTQDMKPIRVSAEWGNTGTVLTGENEYSFGATWGMIGGTEQLVSYNFTTDEAFENLQAHSIFYQLPLENRDTFQLIGAYVTSEGSVDLANAPLGLTGENVQVTAEYFHRLPTPMRRANHKIFLATDYKTTNNNLIFGGTDLLEQEAGLFHIRGGYEFKIRDDNGYTSLEAAGVVSPGNLGNNNTDEAFSGFREGAESDYRYAFAKLERLQQFPHEFLLRAEATVQFSDEALLSTEQLLAGGHRTLRGLNENALRGDRGVRGQIELLAPEVSLIPKIDDKARVFVFVDAANLTQFDASLNGSADTSVGVVTGGIGLTYRLGANLNARLSYGHLIHQYDLDDLTEDGRFNFGLSVSY